MACVALIIATAGQVPAAIITNGSFETGDFTDWISTDIGAPFDVQAVLAAGTPTAFAGFLGPNVVIPTHGNFAASNGFDGGGPGVISLAQDIGVIAPGDLLTFDYRAGYDLNSFGAVLDRFFRVLIEPMGGGGALLDSLVLTAPAFSDTAGGPNSDTGPLSTAIDLSSLAGTDARVNFVWTVPEDFTGPANAQLDNVRITSAVPEPSSLALFALGTFGMGIVAARRRRRRAERNRCCLNHRAKRQ